MPKNMHESYWYFSCSSFTSLQLDHSELVMFLQVLVYYIYATNMNITLVSIFHGSCAKCKLFKLFLFDVDGNWRWIFMFQQTWTRIVMALTSDGRKDLVEPAYFVHGNMHLGCNQHVWSACVLRSKSILVAAFDVAVLVLLQQRL